MIELSLVIPTRNSGDRLQDTIRRLESASSVLPASSELLIIDDGSVPPLVHVAADRGWSMRWYRHGRQLGASAARNTGAALARGDWLLFCDDDIDIRPESLAQLWSARDSRRCIVPEARGPSGDLQNAVHLHWHLFDPKFVFLPHPTSPVAFPVGMCFFIHRDLYWAAGGFDERFFPNYFEDTAFGMALLRLGASTEMMAGAVAFHDEHGGDRSLSNKNRISEFVLLNRWVFGFVALKGDRRALNLGLGIPRVAIQSVRWRDWAPVRGYVAALRRLFRLRGSGPLVRPVYEKLERSQSRD